MQNNDSQNKLTEVFEINNMSNVERDAFFARGGSIVIDSAVGRLLLSLNEAEIAQLELYFDTHENIEDMISHLLKTYPQFEDILQEEVVAFQAEAEKVIFPTLK